MSKGSIRRPESTPGKYAAGWEAAFGAKNTKRVRKATKSVQPYPSWVCSDCATKAGGRMRDGDCATWHTGDCEVCGITQWVTQPRDYGYPRFK